MGSGRFDDATGAGVYHSGHASRLGVKGIFYLRHGIRWGQGQVEFVGIGAAVDLSFIVLER